VSGGTFSNTAIEIIKWVKKIAVAQPKVTHILRPGKASEKTPKGVIPPSLCEILQNPSREKKCVSVIRGDLGITEEGLDPKTSFPKFDQADFFLNGGN
jgi:hypothetical protein